MRILFPVLLLLAVWTRPAASMEAIFEVASTAELGNPHDIDLSADGKLLYVADVDNNRIAVLDARTLEEVDEFARGELRGPHDVDLGPDGLLFVADTHNHRIAVYRPSGTSASHVRDIKGKFRAPEGAVHLRDNIVVAPGAWSGDVLLFDKGKLTARKSGLSSPHDVEPARDGKTFWLADSGNNRLLNLTLDLEIVSELNGAPFNFNGVRYLSQHPDGTLWAADKYTHRVLAIDPVSKTVKLVLGTGRPGKGKNVFRTPEGVVARGDTVWISDSGNNRIVRYVLKP